MDKNAIRNFFGLGNLLGKMTEEELKTPQGQMLQKEYCAVRKEYDEWKDAVNDPAKLQEMQKQMEIDSALGILANALNAYIISPLPKPMENEVYQKAFASLVSKVKDKNLEQEDKNV